MEHVGATRVVVVRAILDAPDPAAATRGLRRKLDALAGAAGPRRATGQNAGRVSG